MCLAAPYPWSDSLSLVTIQVAAREAKALRHLCQTDRKAAPDLRYTLTRSPLPLAQRGFSRRPFGGGQVFRRQGVTVMDSGSWACRDKWLGAGAPGPATSRRH